MSAAEWINLSKSVMEIINSSPHLGFLSNKQKNDLVEQLNNLSIDSILKKIEQKLPIMEMKAAAENSPAVKLVLEDLVSKSKEIRTIKSRVIEIATCPKCAELPRHNRQNTVCVTFM
jgi:hypothetical protein